MDCPVRRRVVTRSDEYGVALRDSDSQEINWVFLYVGLSDVLRLVEVQQELRKYARRRLR